jgi:hypothetical protein
MKPARPPFSGMHMVSVDVLYFMCRYIDYVLRMEAYAVIIREE